MAVKVQFLIGHSSKLRSKKTVEGFTHDWELYVKGFQQADISAFVEKIVFNLHESFPKPKRVCKEPPYSIHESGYAGFIVFIDIYFRNRDEPKKVQFSYDLDLQQNGPPQHRSDVQKFIFDNPSEEFRQKLLKGGGVPVSGVVGGPASAAITNTPSLSTQVVPPTMQPPGEPHKITTIETKKHKSRPDDAKLNSFANLFGTPITKTAPAATIAAVAPTKQSPDNKMVAAQLPPPTSSGIMPVVKEKSSKDKEKSSSSEKSKERSEKKEKHHKQSLTSPHKEGRSESKKSESNKHEKRDRTEEKSKKDKSRDKDRERDRDKSSAGSNNSSSSSKRPQSPKSLREVSPQKPLTASSVANAAATTSNANSIPRPSSSNSGKIEASTKSSKESSSEGKSKDSKQKESSSSSSGKKSKKEKKDKDKERDKEKRHEEKEKQKLAESQHKSSKEDNKSITPSNNLNTNTATTTTNESKSSKPTTIPPATSTTNPNDIKKSEKPEKISKPDMFKSAEKPPLSNTSSTGPLAAPSSNDKKPSASGTTSNSSSALPEKDKRSHKHRKKEKNKDKDRERDKERDKDKDKERDKDKDKDKEKETKKEKEVKEKLIEEKASEISPAPLSANNSQNTTTPILNSAEASKSIAPSSNSSSTTPALATSTAVIPTPTTTTTSSTKSSKNKEKKSKEKSSKEDKLKHKSIDVESAGIKSKQAKLAATTNSSSTNPTPTTVKPPPAPIATPSIPASITPAVTNSKLDLIDAEHLTSTPIASSAIMPMATGTTTNIPNTKTSLQPKPQPPHINTHSDSSNSSFPDLPPITKQPTQPKSQATSQALIKPTPAPTIVAPPTPVVVAPSTQPPPIKEPRPKVSTKSAKDKMMEKSAKEDSEKEKKKRRNSIAVNTFIEPPLKQLKKDQSKSVREKSKSPSLRNTGSRASMSEVTTTFLQPGASPSSTAAAAPLPPPSLAPSDALSPVLSATEAVGNATSATANAATCNSNSTPSSTTNSSHSVALAPHQLPLDYLSELQELHHKIMTLQDNEDLQHVVELIAATGCYEITTKTFDFDLCKLDRGTVQRLQEFFATSVS